MAAQLVKTSCKTGENDIDDLDMNTWLTQNRLTKLKQYFQDNEVILADLLKYEEDDMDVVLKDVNITAGAYIKRFKDAVRELQHMYSKTNTSQNNLNKVYRIVTSMKEDNCMKLLETKMTEIDIALQNNINITSKSMKNTKQIENEINVAFNTYKNKLDERRKLIINTLNQESNKQQNVLQNQKNNLEEYKISIQTAQKEQNSLVLDPQIDRTKREDKIDQITNNVMNSMNDMKTVIHLLAFAVDNSAVNKYITSIGTIRINPYPPTLSVTDVDTVSAIIRIECKANNDIISYGLKYKTRDIDDDEKKTDWNDIGIDNNEYKLTNLQQNTKYIICGKYKTSKDNTWSTYSNVLSFQTLQLQEDTFDGTDMGNGVVVNSNIATWTSATWAWYTVLGTLSVKRGKHEWKLRVNKLGYNESAHIVLGVVTTKKEKEQWTFYWSNDTNFNYAFGTGDGRLNKFNTNNNMNKFKWKTGDNIVMLLDLENDSMKYTINGKSATIQNSTHVKDAAYKLVVCNYGKDTQVQLVSYRAL